MTQGLINTIYQHQGLSVILSKPFHAGYSSGRNVIVSRARQDYECTCGDSAHRISRGSLYMTFVPDRFASYMGQKYRKRFNIIHCNWWLKIHNRKGELIAEISPSHKEGV